MAANQINALIVGLSQNVSTIVLGLSANATVLVSTLFEKLKSSNSEDTKAKIANFTQNIILQANQTFVKLQNVTYVTEKLEVAKGRIETMEHGLLYAYVGLLTMAVLPILFGSIGSLKLKKSKKSAKKSEDSDDEDRDQTEFFSLEEARMFPVYASFSLLSLYILFTYFDKEYINYLLTGYFGIAGVGALTTIIVSVIRLLTGFALKGDYKIQMFHKNKEFFYWRFGIIHLFASVLAILANVYYVFTKNWVVSNLLAEAFSVTAVQLLNLDNFGTGIVLLAALFFYDIFWVFGTDVMVTVAKNFEAPIKVVWPKDILKVIADGIFNKTSSQFTMLGLGDIVIPGIYICLCIQFDYHLYLKTPAGKKNPNTKWFPKPYFHSVLIAYIAGLVTTVLVMHGFQSAQPALLYLSPACIFSSLFLALIRGELTEFFKYEREGASSTSQKPEDASSKKKVIAEKPAEKNNDKPT
ncbi:hypothetical protein HK096_000185, partial [Nowakowskiella sp. JEL0078]